MKKIILRIIAIAMSTLFLFLLLFNLEIFGIPASKLEQDARSGHHIDTSWSVAKSVNGKIGTMIFYDEQMQESVFSIYLNRDGFSFGYFFKAGGSIGAISDGVAEFTYMKNDSALISMNRNKVEKIVFGNKDISPILVDPMKPFAVVIPDNCDSFTVFDINGKIIPVSVYINY